MVSLKLVRADEPRRLVGAQNRLWSFTSGQVQDVPDEVAEICLQIKYRDGMPVFERVDGGLITGSNSGHALIPDSVAPCELGTTYVRNDALPIKKNEEIENALGIQLTWETWQRLSPQ